MWIKSGVIFSAAVTACCQQPTVASALPPYVVKEDRPARTPPDHLAPIPAYTSDGYYHALFRTFLGKRSAALSVIYCSSWGYQGEEAVILFQDPFTDRKAWHLEHAQAKEKIWNWDLLVKGGDLLRSIEVDRKQIEVPKEFAAKISLAWSAVCDAVRFPDDPPLVSDASIVLFSCDDRFGQASFPGFVGSPQRLATLGGKLRALVSSEPNKRDELIRECGTLADEIIVNARKPNKAPEPSTHTVMPRADARATPVRVVAHL